MMVNVMDFFNKNIGNYPYKQYSFIQGDGNGICDEYVRKRYTEGIYGTAHMSWAFLVPTRFGFQ
jgi:hypothetical protein